MNTSRILLSIVLLILISCNKTETMIMEEEADLPVQRMYFPPIHSEEWKTTDIDSLGWSRTKLDDLGAWLSDNNTKAFIILHQGKIAYEAYWGTNLQGNSDFDRSSNWYWASAGKSLMASLTGKAQELQLLDIEEPSNTYLGNGWTSMPLEQENQILIRHHLSMTTGLDYQVTDLDCTSVQCLDYKADPGEQWYYHNAPYSLMAAVIEQATNTGLNSFTEEYILDPIGMEGFWLPNGYGRLFFSNARSAARFGLLALSGFQWEDQPILSDSIYIQNMSKSSQALNPSYGYLWWLNGQSSIVVPGLPNNFDVPLSTSAPSDLVAALGKNGQFIEYVPSLDVVVVRFGDTPDDSAAAIQFHDKMWSRLSPIIN